MQRPAKPFTPVRFRIQPPNIMKIGIIGYGFVGKALFDAFHDSVEAFKVDLKLNTTIENLCQFNPDATFICLPTPMQDDGNQDISVVEETFVKIKNLNLPGLIILKSTVHPGNINILEKLLPNFVYNPEFLREKHASDDFINSKLIVFGGKQDSTNKLSKIYSNYIKCKHSDYIFTDAVSASLMKYTINAFLATKVIFFNEIHNLFNATNTNESWENFIKFLSRDSRIGNSHMMVPGHDDRFGFGGACFPKDTAAIMKYSNSLDIELGLIKNAISTNNQIRAKYNKETDREYEQNIKYTNIEE